MNPIEQKELFKFNMIKDRRRRLILPIANTDTGYHIPDRDMKKIGFLNANSMWVMLVFVMSVGIFNLSMTIGVLLAVLVLIGLESYKRFIFLKNKAVIKIVESDLALLQSEEALKVQRSDARMEVTFGAVLILLIFARFAESQGFQGIEFIVAVLAISACASYMVTSAVKWRKLSKKLKLLKQDKKD